MIFDSEEQRQLLIRLLMSAPAQTTLGDLFSGKPLQTDPQVNTLVKAINEATIAEEPEPDAP